MNARAERPRWPRVPPRFTAAALSGHSALGLAFGALIHLVCLTGVLCVFVDELRGIEQPAPAPAPLRPGALDRAVAAALAASPAPPSALYVTDAATPRQRAIVTAYGPSGSRAWLADGDGALTPQRTRWTEFLVALHIDLTAPAPWGAMLVGVGGAALLSLIASGVLSHPRIFRDAFRLRLGGSWRLREAELHNRLSVWGLPFHLVVTLTGAFFGLAGLVSTLLAPLAFHGDAARLFRPVTGPPVAADARAAPLPDLERLAAGARALRPGSALSYVGVERPGTRGARITVEVTAPGRLPRGEQAYYDARGALLGRGRFASGSPGLQAYSAAAQLHFGFFGGLAVRLAYGVLGAALTFVAASGVSIWLARRRDRGRPAPRLERAWAAWTWGVPMALLLSAAASRLLPPAGVFWGATMLAQAAAQISRRRLHPMRSQARFRC